MNELPEHRRAITGKAQREAFDHARGSMKPDGPYSHDKPIVSWIIVAVALVLTAVLLLAV